MTYTEKELAKTKEIISQIPQEEKDKMLLELLINNDAIAELLSNLKENEENVY